MIKFHCKHCSGKIGVKDEYAGKRVRCPKCKQPVRVPAPEPDDDFELEMVSAGDGGDDFDLEMVSEGDAGGALYALAEMEAGAAAEIPSHQQQPAGNACPQCGKACAPRTKVCVNCGYNFKTRGKLKTNVQADTPSYGAYRPSPSSSYQPNWLDRQLGGTSTLVILLFGCCCGLSLPVGIIGLIICKDPQARQNALILVIIQVVINALAIIQAVATSGVAPGP